MIPKTRGPGRPKTAFLVRLDPRNGCQNGNSRVEPHSLPVFGSDVLFTQSWITKMESFHTKRAYLKVAEDLLNFTHPKKLSDLTFAAIQNFIETYYFKSHETKRQRIGILKSLFSFGVKSGYFVTNPTVMISSPQSHSKLTERYLTEEEVMKMITLTESPRDLAILKVLYSGGVRVSELVGLNWGDLQSRENGSGQIKVRGKGNQERVVVLSESTFLDLTKLKSQHSKDHDPIFLSRQMGRLSVGAVQLLVDQARLRASITRKVSPHWLRHAHASHALDRGAPIHLVQSTLGHKSVATTGKYLHSRPQDSSSRFLGI
jgi:integrase/recombinase XerD